MNRVGLDSDFWPYSRKVKCFENWISGIRLDSVFYLEKKSSKITERKLREISKFSDLNRINKLIKLKSFFFVLEITDIQ